MTTPNYSDPRYLPLGRSFNGVSGSGSDSQSSSTVAVLQQQASALLPDIAPHYNRNCAPTQTTMFHGGSRPHFKGINDHDIHGNTNSFGNSVQPEIKKSNDTLRDTIMTPSDQLLYELEIGLQPCRARATNVTKLTGRRVVDPPPVVTLKLHRKNPDGSKGENIVNRALGTFFVVVSVIPLELVPEPDVVIKPSIKSNNKKNSNSSSVPKKKKEIENLELKKNPKEIIFGTTASSSILVWKADHRAFFIFTDISIKAEGTYKLKFTLYEFLPIVTDLDIYESNSTKLKIHNPELVNLMPRVIKRKSILSEEFRAYSPKDFPGLQSSPQLIRDIARLGAKVRIRNADTQKRPLKNPEENQLQRKRLKINPSISIPSNSLNGITSRLAQLTGIPYNTINNNSPTPRFNPNMAYYANSMSSMNNMNNMTGFGGSNILASLNRSQTFPIRSNNYSIKPKQNTNINPEKYFDEQTPILPSVPYANSSTPSNPTYHTLPYIPSQYEADNDLHPISNSANQDIIDFSLINSCYWPDSRYYLNDNSRTSNSSLGLRGISSPFGVNANQLQLQTNYQASSPSLASTAVLPNIADVSGPATYAFNSKDGSVSSTTSGTSSTFPSNSASPEVPKTDIKGFYEAQLQGASLSGSSSSISSIASNSLTSISNASLQLGLGSNLIATNMQSLGSVPILASIPTTATGGNPLGLNKANTTTAFIEGEEEEEDDNIDQEEGDKEKIQLIGCDNSEITVDAGVNEEENKQTREDEGDEELDEVVLPCNISATYGGFAAY